MLNLSGEIWCSDEKAFWLVLKKSFKEAFDVGKSVLFFMEIENLQVMIHHLKCWH